MITYDDLVRWDACSRADGQCYSREALDERLGAGWALTLKEILRLDWVRAEDRVWVACQPGVLSDAGRTAWLDIVVERAVRTHALTCGVPAVEAWAARWLSGEDRSAAEAWAAEEAAAEAWAAEEAVEEAWAAAWAAEAARAARTAAWARTAEAAAWAARTAAWARAAEAARTAAWARTAEAWAAERGQQVVDLLGVLDNEETR